MARRLRTLDPVDLAEAWRAWGAAEDRMALRALVKHFLAALEELAPGHSVEVRVPPYAAVQVVAGARHTRGTPPAVIEMDPLTWLALASGKLAWSDAEASGALRASGERADLTAYLPLA